MPTQPLPFHESRIPRGIAVGFESRVRCPDCDPTITREWKMWEYRAHWCLSHLQGDDTPTTAAPETELPLQIVPDFGGYRLGDPLATQGANSTVFAVWDMNDNEFVAKRATYSQTMMRECELYTRMGQQLTVTTHPNIVRMHSLVPPYMIFEKCPKSLAQRIRDTGIGYLTDAAIREYSRELLAGLAYVHDVLHAVHGDIKPDNLLIGKDGKLKVGDFGTWTNWEWSVERVIAGAGQYRAPEVRKAGKGQKIKCSCRIDIWSAGCVMAEMLCRKEIMRDATVTAEVVDKDLEERNVPLKSREFIMALLANREEDRPSARDALARLDRQDRPPAAPWSFAPFSRMKKNISIAKYP